MVERLPAVPAFGHSLVFGSISLKRERMPGHPGGPANGRQYGDSRPSSGTGCQWGTPRHGLGHSKGGFTTKTHLRVNVA